MKKSLLFFSIISFIAISVFAQVKHNQTVKSYLNNGQTTTGGHTKDEVLSQLSEPLLSIDEKGKKRYAVSYYLTYKERNVFYDENGKPFIDSDTYTIESNGGVIEEDWRSILTERLKVGDTLKFEGIKNFNSVKNQDSSFYSEPIIIYIK